ncbi:hypothetical protein D3C74_257310 [compost metagenome]
MGFDLPLDYIDVAERIRHLREHSPEASLQQVSIEFVRVAEQDYVVYTAACYRSADDPRPGIGTAWEQIPGKTPYTRGSEVQNAETAAWGRAIIAALRGEARGRIASAEEVRNQRAKETAQAGPPRETLPPLDAHRTAVLTEDFLQEVLEIVVSSQPGEGRDEALRSLWPRLDPRLREHVIEVPRLIGGDTQTMTAKDLLAAARTAVDEPPASEENVAPEAAPAAAETPEADEAPATTEETK